MFILKENQCIDSITQKHHVLYDDDCKYNYCYMSRYVYFIIVFQTCFIQVQRHNRNVLSDDKGINDNMNT